MRRATQVLMGAVLLSLMLSSVPAGAAVRSAGPTSTVSQRLAWTPPTGVVFNDPGVRDRRRAIISKVVQSIKATAPLETIRIIVWNLDDRPVADALIAAQQRGVNVQVVVSGVVDNPNWDRIRARLNQNTTDDSFAVKCRAACRSKSRITHVKIFMFSRINTATKIAMFGSTNLTTAAGNRQWNDLVTVRNAGLYDYWVQKFAEFARDRAVANPYEVRTFGAYRSTLFPAAPRNPVATELSKVRCKGATGGTGNGAGRTEVRIAIAGWFDAYGQEIANRLRQMWDRGCDVKIVTTLAGRGVNRTLKQGYGRGPVPVREVTRDRNGDGIPERYLHLKSLAISGVYGGDTSASALFTGSPNWSYRAQHSDEVWVRVLNHPGLVRAYQRHVNNLYGSRFAHARSASSGTQFGRTAAGTTTIPKWFEND